MGHCLVDVVNQALLRVTRRDVVLQSDIVLLHSKAMTEGKLPRFILAAANAANGRGESTRNSINQENLGVSPDKQLFHIAP